MILVATAALLIAAADVTAPVLGVPDDIHYQQKQRGAVVRMTYTVAVTDDTDPHPRVRCLPKSGSTFAVGTTKVTCTATDKAGNRATDSFKIVVTAPKRR